MVIEVVWLLNSQSMYTCGNERCLYNKTSLFHPQKHTDRWHVPWECSTLSMHSTLSSTLGRKALKDLRAMFELAAAYYAAEGTAECPVF